MSWRNVAGTGCPPSGGVPLPSSLGSRVASFAGSRFFVPCIALAALAAIDLTALYIDVSGVQLWVLGPRRATAHAATRARGVGDAHSKPSTPSASSPQLEFSTERLDLGDGKPNEVLHGELKLTNRGSQTTKFLLVKHCGCTELSPKSGELVPGASETIQVAVELLGHANSEMSTSIDVQGGEPSRILARCVLRGRCPAPFDVTPTVINFGSLAVEELRNTSAEVRLESVAGRPPVGPDEIVVDLAGDVFHVDRAVARSPGSCSLRIAINANVTAGEHYDTLDIRLRGSEYSMRVPLRLHVADLVGVVPSVVHVRKDESTGRPKPVSLLVIHRKGDTPRKITLLEAPMGVSMRDEGPIGAAGLNRRLILYFDEQQKEWARGGSIVFCIDGSKAHARLQRSPVFSKVQ